MGSFQKNDLPMNSIDFASKATQNNYEITVMTLKGKTFPGFKIQRYIDGFLFSIFILVVLTTLI